MLQVHQGHGPNTDAIRRVPTRPRVPEIPDGVYWRHLTTHLGPQAQRVGAIPEAHLRSPAIARTEVPWTQLPGSLPVGRLRETPVVRHRSAHLGVQTSPVPNRREPLGPPTSPQMQQAAQVIDHVGQAPQPPTPQQLSGSHVPATQAAVQERVHLRNPSPHHHHAPDPHCCLTPPAPQPRRPAAQLLSDHAGRESPGLSQGRSPRHPRRFG